MSLALIINGEARQVPCSTGSAALETILTALSMRKELVAIALNDTIVPKAQWCQTLVYTGDRIEIVHFVGGGSPFHPDG